MVFFAWYFALLQCEVCLLCEGGEWYTVAVKVAFLLGCGSLFLKQLIRITMQISIGSDCGRRSRTEKCFFSTQKRGRAKSRSR